MPLIVSDISKRYGSQQVLDSISLTVQPGEIMGFLGPNGAGKSTLMKIITGYVKADSGTVTLYGKAAGPDHLAAKQLVGYLPEHNPLYLDMYVREYLSFAAGFYHLDKPVRERLDEVIEQTGLTQEYKKRIGQLSKGYRQRVGIAQAIIHDPKVIILDEPTTGLDPNQLIEIRQLIQNLGKDRCVLFSTHILQEVEAICNKVAIINNGKLVANLDTAEALAQHTNIEELFRTLTLK